MTEIFIEHNADAVAARFGKAANAIPDEVLQPVADRLGDEALRLFRGTIRTWRHKPVFQKLTEARGGDISVLVGTDNFIYSIVDKGSRPHTIEARHASVLAFPAQSTPKTVPGVLKSGSGSISGPTVFRRRVRHPGTRARGFTKRIFELIERKMPSEVKTAIGRWVRKFG